MKESSGYVTPLASLVSYAELTKRSTISLVFDITCILSRVLLKYSALQ